MTPDEIQIRALETWYAEGHPLRLNPLPCLFGLAGETGELVDLCKKDLYKPRFTATREMWLDEAGDVLFYLSIRCFQLGISIIELPCVKMDAPIAQSSVIVGMNAIAAALLEAHHTDRNLSASVAAHREELRLLQGMKSRLYMMCKMLNMTLDELSQLNYQKLITREKNNTGYNRGIGK